MTERCLSDGYRTFRRLTIWLRFGKWNHCHDLKKAKLTPALKCASYTLWHLTSASYAFTTACKQTHLNKWPVPQYEKRFAKMLRKDIVETRQHLRLTYLLTQNYFHSVLFAISHRCLLETAISKFGRKVWKSSKIQNSKKKRSLI